MHMSVDLVNWWCNYTVHRRQYDVCRHWVTPGILLWYFYLSDHHVFKKKNLQPRWPLPSLIVFPPAAKGGPWDFRRFSLRRCLRDLPACGHTGQFNTGLLNKSTIDLWIAGDNITGVRCWKGRDVIASREIRMYCGMCWKELICLRRRRRGVKSVPSTEKLSTRVLTLPEFNMRNPHNPTHPLHLPRHLQLRHSPSSPRDPSSSRVSKRESSFTSTSNGVTRIRKPRSIPPFFLEKKSFIYRNLPLR